MHGLAHSAKAQVRRWKAQLRKDVKDSAQGGAIRLGLDPPPNNISHFAFPIGKPGAARFLQSLRSKEPLHPEVFRTRISADLRSREKGPNAKGARSGCVRDCTRKFLNPDEENSPS